jgi:hypothetical protein
MKISSRKFKIGSVEAKIFAVLFSGEKYELTSEYWKLERHVPIFSSHYMSTHNFI